MVLRRLAGSPCPRRARALGAKRRGAIGSQAARPSAGRHRHAGCRGPRWAETRFSPHPPSGRRDTLRASVTCCLGAGEWPAHGARSAHRKPARGDPPFRRGSDARGAGATDPCPACRCQAARKHPARATARACKTSPEQRPHRSAKRLFSPDPTAAGPSRRGDAPTSCATTASASRCDRRSPGRCRRPSPPDPPARLAGGCRRADPSP